jgi:hypothetical protein
MNDSRFRVTVVSLPHRHGDQTTARQQFHGEGAVHEMLDRQSIPHLRIGDSQVACASHVLKKLRPHYIFRQRPWRTDLPIDLDGRALTFARVCYIPYGYMTAGFEDLQFNSEFHQICDLMFWPDEIHRTMAIEHGLGDARRSVVTGYPKFDYLCGVTEQLWPVRIHSPTAKPFRLIWAPHWTVSDQGVRDTFGMRYGAFHQLYPEIMRLARCHPFLQITMRPHPILMQRMECARPGSAYADFLTEWDKLPNCAVSREPDYGPLFRASDGLLTDCLSFLTEYQLFEKPLVFFRRSDSMQFNRAGKRIVGGLYTIQNPAEIEPLLLRLAKGEEQSQIVEERRRVVRSIYPYPGEAASRIADELIRRLDAEMP